jgi:hypothetical protein
VKLKDRKPVFDKRAYMRNYMACYRKGQRRRAGTMPMLSGQSASLASSIG